MIPCANFGGRSQGHTTFSTCYDHFTLDSGCLTRRGHGRVRGIPFSIEGKHSLVACLNAPSLHMHSDIWISIVHRRQKPDGELDDCHPAEHFEG